MLLHAWAVTRDEEGAEARNHTIATLHKKALECYQKSNREPPKGISVVFSMDWWDMLRETSQEAFQYSRLVEKDDDDLME